jgi:hypothetical protein
MRKLSFRIREVYFDQIVAGTKTVEFRRDIEFWRIRLANIFGKEAIQGDFQITPEHSGVELQAVFIVKKKIHRRRITGIERMITPDHFSAQGKKDVSTPRCLAFHLGECMDEV